jgi:hypothetical protein
MGLDKNHTSHNPAVGVAIHVIGCDSLSELKKKRK